MLLLLDDFGVVSVSTRTKLGMDVATLDGRGFLVFAGSRIFTTLDRFTELLCLVGGADATKERPSRFSGMECSAACGFHGDVGGHFCSEDRIGQDQFYGSRMVWERKKKRINSISFKLKKKVQLIILASTSGYCIDGII